MLLAAAQTDAQAALWDTHSKVLQEHLPERQGPSALVVADVKGLVCLACFLVTTLLRTFAKSELTILLSLQTVDLQPHNMPYNVAGQQYKVIIVQCWQNDPVSGALAGVDVSDHT